MGSVMGNGPAPMSMQCDLTVGRIVERLRLPVPLCEH